MAESDGRSLPGQGKAARRKKGKGNKKTPAEIDGRQVRRVGDTETGDGDGERAGERETRRQEGGGWRWERDGETGRGRGGDTDSESEGEGRSGRWRQNELEAVTMVVCCCPSNDGQEFQSFHFAVLLHRHSSSSSSRRPISARVLGLVLPVCCRGHREGHGRAGQREPPPPPPQPAPRSYRCRGNLLATTTTRDPAAQAGTYRIQQQVMFRLHLGVGFFLASCDLWGYADCLHLVERRQDTMLSWAHHRARGCGVCVRV